MDTKWWRKMFLLWAVLVSAQGMAQTLSGTVRDAKTGDPVMFANVALLREADSSFVRGTTSDEQGVFALAVEDSAALLLRVSAIGYEPLYAAVEGFPEVLRMVPTAVNLAEVQVTDKRPLYAVDGEKKLYNVSEDPSVQTGTASDALQNAPEVEVDAEGNITLRGTQGVTVWINDRPSHMSAEGLKQYIKLMPANTIERIEVITNPSARYGGGSPVVNIVTTAKIKRNEFFSFGANATTKPYVCPWLSYVYANDRFSFNIYANMDYESNWNEQEGSGMLRNEAGDTSCSREWESWWQNRNMGGYLYINGHYDFDSTRTLSFWGGMYPMYIRSQGWTEMHRTEHLLSPSDYSYRDDDTCIVPKMGFYSGVDYTHIFDTNGHKLSISAYANGYGYKNYAQSARRYAVVRQYDYWVESLSRKSLRPELSLEADYRLPFAQHWELELGGGISNDREDYSYASDTITAAGLRHDWLRSYADETRTLGWMSYATLLRRIGNFSVKVGLNAGQKHLWGVWEGFMHDTVDCGYWKFVPSVHLSYRTESMHNFSLSYTRRTELPTADQLTHFVNYGTDSYSIGNPALSPCYTHNVEGSWDKYFDKFGSVGAQVFYSAIVGEIRTLQDAAMNEVLGGRTVSYQQPVNVGNSSVGGGSINVTYRPSAFLNVRFSGMVYDYYYKMQYRPGEWREEDMWSGSLRFNVWAKLWGKLQVFGTLNYSGRRLGMFQIAEPVFTADMGLSADFFERRLSVFVNVADIFNTNVRGMVNTHPYNSAANSVSSNSRYVSVGVTLRFGKMELENQARQGAE